MSQLLLGPLVNWAKRLRFPWLLAITATLFGVTLVVPDPIPFVDEILLALGTLLFASLKQRRADKRIVKDAVRE
ncbi:MAG: DUF6116 family protein [Pseudomarimonas sp.]